MRFFKYFFANNVFVIALLALSLMSAVYLVSKVDEIDGVVFFAPFFFFFLLFRNAGLVVGPVLRQSLASRP